MQIEVIQLDEKIMEIRLRENLTAANATDFKTFIETKIEENESGEAYILNFLDMEFLDSSGISALVYLHRKVIRASKKLAIVYDNHVVEEVFVLTKLNKLFNLHKDFEEALEDLQD